MTNKFILGLCFLIPVSFLPVLGQKPELSSLIEPFVERDALAGAVVVVADKDEELTAQSFGFSDRKSERKMSIDSIFWIASQSKPMTAVAVMTLVDQGKISLDDPVEKYLPEFRSQLVVAEKKGEQVILEPPVHPITIREVLSHMSGLPFKSALEHPTLDALPLRVAVGSFAMTPLQTQPGTHYQYSNAGIKTAARVLEVVSGMPYEDYMDKVLFNPLGMKTTTFWPTDEQAGRIAKSYRPNADKTGLEETKIGQLLYPLQDRSKRFPMPAGGLFSTARDTARFCQMMLNRGVWKGKRYLSEESFEALTSRQTPSTVKQSYGLGFSVGNGSFGHGGAHATGMEIRTEEGLVLVWMVQHAGFPKDGNKAQGVFKNWAQKKFSKK
jgi:CubicO group peptidase (beta-lactamase class C family)